MKILMMGLSTSVAEGIDISLMVVGGVILVAALATVAIRRRWQPALSCVPLRTSRLDLVHVAFVLVVFMLAFMLLNRLGVSLTSPAGMSQDEWRGTGQMPGLWSVAAQSAAKLIAAGALVVLAGMSLEGGLAGFGLTHKRMGRDVAWAILGYLAIWPLCMGVAQLVVLVSGRPQQHAVMLLLHSPKVPSWGITVLWLSAVVVSPLSEELFFRGLLQTVFRGYADRPWIAITLASIAFGMVHINQPQYVAALTVLGFALGYLYEHTGSLIGPVLMHILFNARTMIFDYMLHLR
jgi:membrane protease YdiL (CAAX protease family)